MQELDVFPAHRCAEKPGAHRRMADHHPVVFRGFLRAGTALDDRPVDDLPGGEPQEGYRVGVDGDRGDHPGDLTSPGRPHIWRMLADEGSCAHAGKKSFSRSNSFSGAVLIQ